MAGISDVMKRDHRNIRDTYQRIIEAQDEDTATRWANQLTWELARYSVAEELVVYPVLQRNMDHGAVIADKNRNQNQQIKTLLSDFQNLKAGDQRFRPLLDSIMENVNKHIDEEEDEDLPSLEAVIETDDSETMGKRFDQTKVLMPTRAHPSAPTQPVFESAMSLMQAPIDRISDIMRSFPEE
ncbi:hypothetical protein VTO42DRAFT_4230 [Malbranchea cinnamomea]